MDATQITPSKSPTLNLSSPTNNVPHPPPSPPIITTLFPNSPPITPKIGNLRVYDGTTAIAAWTGESPNATWTGPEDPSSILRKPNRSPVTPPRATSTSRHSTSARHARQVGLLLCEEESQKRARTTKRTHKMPKIHEFLASTTFPLWS